MSYHRGDVLLASLVFTSHTGTKRRPVLVIYDTGDDDVLVVPVTSQLARTQFDITIGDWVSAGLRFPSVARVEKLATLDKAAILRKLGTVSTSDRARIDTALTQFFHSVLGM